MVTDYTQASKGQVSYRVEAVPYTKEANPDKYFGLLRDDIKPVNPNPQTPMGTLGGRRGPYLHAPTERSYQFDVICEVLDANVPFEIALGDRTTTSEDPDVTPASGDEYTKDLFAEADRLKTATIQVDQEDVELQAQYVGCKSNLRLASSVGEALKATFPIFAPIGPPTNKDLTAPVRPNLAIPSTKEPFMFWHKGDVLLKDPDTQATVKTLATVHSIDLGWDNGLQVNHHGKGREGYSVSEMEGEGKYDMKIGVTVLDTALYKRAADDEALVDIEVPFHRPPGQANLRDALIIRLLDCKVTDAPIGVPAKGIVQEDVVVSPLDTQIEIRTPA